MDMQAQKGGRIISPTDCNPALEVGGWLASLSGRLTPRKPDTHCTESWVGLGGGAIWTARKIDLRVVQTVASLYTDWAIPGATRRLPDNICHSFRLIRVTPRKPSIITVQCTNQNLKSFSLINLNNFNRTRARKCIHGLHAVGDLSNQFNQTN